MRTFSKIIIFWSAVVLVLTASAQAKEWRGIVPLHSTRTDVEQLLGPPAIDRSDITFYEFEKEQISIHYARVSCTVDPAGWNVPLDTVLSVWITPRLNSLTLADLRLDERTYKKVREVHVENLVNYIDEEEGINYQVDTSDDDKVTLIQYLPAAKDSYLLCQPRRTDDLTETLKVDEYSGISSQDEKRRLDGLAGKLEQYPDALGYIIVYAGRRASLDEAKLRAARLKEYLLNERRVDANRLEAIDGGYREAATVELYLVARGLRPPTARPTLKPEDVEIIKNRP